MRSTAHRPAAYETALAVSQSLFSAPGRLPPHERLEWAALEFDDIVHFTSQRARVLLLVSLTLVKYLAPLFVRRLGPLTALPLDERTAALERMEASPLGALVLAVKVVLCTVYYEHPDAAREVGWSGCNTGATDRVLPEGPR